MAKEAKMKITASKKTEPISDSADRMTGKDGEVNHHFSAMYGNPATNIMAKSHEEAQKKYFKKFPLKEATIKEK